MGVLFAGFLRAPMTSVFMVLEVSGNYSIIVPVIVANTFAYLISRSLQAVPIFDLFTKQDGLVLPSLEEQREQTILLVEDAMRTATPPVLRARDTVQQAIDRVQNLPDEIFFVQVPQDGWNIINRDTLKKLMEDGKSASTLVSVLPIRNVPHLHPDMPLEMALRYVSQFPLVPVVHRADLHKLIGIISREDIIKKYQLSPIEEE
jgi:CIC family chloride channel protein